MTLKIWRFSIKRPDLGYDKWPSVPTPCPIWGVNIFRIIEQGDLLSYYVPYQSYHTVLQFFNQAALDPLVTDISITLYRIAGDSLIGNAPISAAKMVKCNRIWELKARFDEANNIRWSKRMRAGKRA